MDMIGKYHMTEDEIDRYRRSAVATVSTWKRRFCWLPKYCYLTGARIWWEHAYVGVKDDTLTKYFGFGEKVTLIVSESALIQHRLTRS